MPLSLLQTKLYIPALRQRLVARPALAAKLRAGALQPITLIAAPAGFGKTTVVSEWVAQTTAAVAWLSLDEDDNEPARFLTYLIAALQTQHPQIGASAQGLFNTAQVPPPKTVLTLLLNDLSTLAAPLALVLDDYHLITTPAIHEALAFFIDHLPPFFHLVITTRIDPPLPLARWRARNRLAELRAADLRFHQAEAATFLNEVMGLLLTTSEIATLETRTEGWIAGLQLAALSLQGRTDVASFISAFSGSHRHVIAYLVEEVLERCSVGTLDFLLQTSLLARLTAPLCNAVTGQHDSSQLLKQIEQANLFLIPLDDEGNWYRYHHLFAEVLRQGLQRRLSAEAVADLHRRASTWYKGAALIDEAIHHALAAQAFDQAAVLVEQVALAMLLHSEFAQLLNWLGRLPAAALKVRPVLTLYHSWVLCISGQSHQAAAHLAAVEALLDTDEDKRTPEVQGLLAITKTLLLRDADDLAGAIAVSQQALANLPAQATSLRASITLNLAIAHYLQGELSAAAQLLTETITTGQAAQLIGPLPTIYLKVQILRAQGNLHQALQLCQDGLALVTRHQWQEFPASGFLYVTLGELLRERNELGAATEYLERGIRLGQAGGHHHILIIGHVWLAWLRQTKGNATGSQEVIRVALQLVQQHAGSRFWPLPSAACTQARLWIAQGNLAAANHWAQTSALDQAQATIPYLDEAAYVMLARLRIAEGALTVAAALLLRLHQVAAAAGRNGSLIEILMLQAVTYAAQQQRGKAMTLLAQALRLAGGPLGAEGYVRLFVDEGEAIRWLIYDLRLTNTDPGLVSYMDQLLTAFAEQAADLAEAVPANQLDTPPVVPIVHGKSTSVNLIEPLSDREQEVLQQVAAGLSNTEIAARLIISMSTVKTHINHIFSKLAVQSRTQAIVRARALGLLQD